MKIVSVNVNGIRAAARKGFYDWMLREQADVVCLQELKATEDQLTDALFHPPGYHRYLFCAEKKGYSGVGLYCRKQPEKVQYGLGFDLADQEGRYIQADFDGFSVASLYLPSGSSSEERQAEKYRFMDALEPLLAQMRRRRREFVLCGDWNIAHKEIDLKNWRGNRKNSGFLPEERAWMDRLYGEWGWVDGFRVVNPDADQYTWWSNRGQAWAKNVGWRIDYHVITPGLQDRVVAAEIYKDERFSDHAPLTLTYADEP